MTALVSIDGETIVVSAPDLVGDRMARLFFTAVLGGQATEDGWIVPPGRRGLEATSVRISAFFAKRNIAGEFAGDAERAVQREEQRRRSFLRTREAAVAFREGAPRVLPEELHRQLVRFGWNENERTLRPHQAEGALHALSAINAANFSVPGAGKTATTLAVAAQHLAAETIELVLVVGPLSSFRPWESETRIALGDRLKPVRVRGPRPKRRRAYRRAVAGQILLLSYATAAYDCDVLIELLERKTTMLVVDESHRIKRFRGGFWAPALVELSEYAKVRMVLSGTPMPQSGKDLYTQLSVLWPGGELTGPREEFGRRAEKQFASVLSTIQPFIFRTPKEALGLPPYELIRVSVPLQGLQAEVYDLVESGFRRLARGGGAWTEKIERLSRARPIRLLQAAANPDLLNHRDALYSVNAVDPSNAGIMSRLAQYAELEVPAKTLAGISLVQEIVAEGGKVICWSNFIGNLDGFSRHVRETVNAPCYQIDGRVPAGDTSDDDVPTDDPREEPETRERIIERFLTADGPAVLVANPASISESISLHSACHNAIYLDRTYDCALFLQSVDRIHRLGLPPEAEVRVWLLEATVGGRATVDSLVDASLSRKEAAMRLLLEGAELAPLAQGEAPWIDAEGDEQDLRDLLRYLLGEADDAAVAEV